MAIHIHLSRPSQSTRRTVDAKIAVDAKAKDDGIDDIMYILAKEKMSRSQWNALSGSEREALARKHGKAKDAKTRDCGCGGHDNIPPDQGGSGSGRFPAAVADDLGTREMGAPVNAAWLKLDRLMPDELQRQADLKSIRGNGKSDIIMGILRSQFNQRQMDAWAMFY